MSARGAIMIVDDDEDIRESVSDVLETRGYRTITASNGLEALERLRQLETPPSLVLLDMMMPVMDGSMFVEQLRREARFADLPLVVFSAYGNPREVASMLGAAGCLPKPLRLEELIRMVERYA